MTSRTVPASVQRELEQSGSGDALLAFLTVRHVDLSTPLRFVSDLFDYVKGGLTYTGIVFDFQILGDDEGQPETQLIVPNVDRRIGQILRRSRSRATIDLEIVSSADFDLSADPRTETGTAATIYAFQSFELADVSADVAELRGRVLLRDFAQEPWPFLSASQTRLPGLFR